MVHQRQLRESSKPHSVLTISMVAFLEKDIVNTQVRREDGILSSCQKSLKQGSMFSALRASPTNDQGTFQDHPLHHSLP